MEEMDQEDTFYKQLYEGIMAGIPSTVLIVNTQMYITTANANFYRKSERGVDDTVGKHITEIFPEAINEYTQITDKIETAITQGKPIEVGEFEYKSPRIPNRIYYLRLAPIMNACEVVTQVLVLLDDVTDRKRLGEQIRRTEEHLAKVVKSANDIIVSIDKKGNILSWNKPIEQLTGLRFHEVRGQPFSDIISQKSRGDFASILNRLVKEKALTDREFALASGEGGVEVSWNLSAMEDNSGHVMGFVLIGRDLTERKAMQQKLIQSAKSASLGTMAGGIAHEIRNPLAIVNSVAQILDKNLHDEEMCKQCIQKIRNATTRARDIVENLLTFARGAESITESLDVHEVINTAVSLLENQFALSNVKLRTTFTSAPLHLAGNRNQLQQVFVNILLNACKAIDEEGVVAVRTIRKEQMAHIIIQDNGCGISQQVFPKIFDPFFTTRPVGEGAGLGLSVSSGIVKQHEGQIEVESKRGEGTTFTIKLPMIAE